MEYQPIADDSQLHRSPQPSDTDQTVLSVQECVSDVNDWMIDNKLQLNEDKTKALLFNSSKLQDEPASLSMCQTTVTFSDSVRNLVFYMDKGLSRERERDRDRDRETEERQRNRENNRKRQRKTTLATLSAITLTSRRSIRGLQIKYSK